ncbi:hypothetical protein HN415_00630 [Candidatus Woesearchaeota archaeon]|jgi:LmbE family N-acetylglucosaminyl deacetylase|nr:hypothetical protein [Candidatus Woesearchaeota archaeon]
MKNKKILIISPHPDDPEMEMGMKIFDYTQKGHDVYNLVLCEGELGGDPKIRKEESKKAMEILGVKNTTYHQFPNTLFDEVRNDIKNAIEKEVHKINPDIIYGPWKDDLHIDHRITSQEMLVAARSVPVQIYYPCIQSQNFNPNSIFYGNKKHKDIKLKAIKQHQSQINRGGIDLILCKSSMIYNARTFYANNFHEKIKKQYNLPKKDSLYAEVFKIHKQLL